ncbi:MAG: hypothetical protein WD360_06455 [Nitriliruptoraceae bacterium]
MSRTVRATLIGALSVGVSVVLIGVMLGFSTGASVISGSVFGGLMGLVIWAASRRAETFYTPEDDGPMKESSDG